MWSSIQEILKPQSIEEALAMAQDQGSVFFAGGSYLVSEKDPSITKLIDINPLLPKDLEAGKEGFLVGAGVSLQTLMEAADEQMAQVIRLSCNSKNIRNQRSLGGEIARGRPTSDLLVYLHAAGALVELNQSNQWISIADWEGDGLLSRIHIPKNTTLLERVALLDSTEAFILVALCKSDAFWTLCVGGDIQNLIYTRCPQQAEESIVREFVNRVEDAFVDDHLGTASYKHQLVTRIIFEMAVRA